MPGGMTARPRLQLAPAGVTGTQGWDNGHLNVHTHLKQEPLACFGEEKLQIG